MKFSTSVFLALAGALTISILRGAALAQTPPAGSPAAERTPIAPPAFMPDAAASKIVSVARRGRASKRIVVLTEGIAIKETGPAETIKRFGEVYAFSPATIVVRQNQPTLITFWNLQPDDVHDFAIVDAAGKPLMDLPLPPLSQTPLIFTFHKTGVMEFRCLVHQPAMSGQILVLPAP